MVARRHEQALGACVKHAWRCSRRATCRMRPCWRCNEPWTWQRLSRLGARSSAESRPGTRRRRSRSNKRRKASTAETPAERTRQSTTATRTAKFNGTDAAWGGTSVWRHTSTVLIDRARWKRAATRNRADSCAATRRRSCAHRSCWTAGFCDGAVNKRVAQSRKRSRCWQERGRR